MATLPTSVFGISTSSGWWVAVGCIGGIAVSGTRIAPLTTGILAVALIYQTGLLLKGK